MYPNGYKFEIDPSKLVDAEEMIEAAINEAEPDPSGTTGDDTDNNEGE